ncbi:TPA: Rpn family recombination-promoting nuclease/putative transposase [Serratia fonticola]
MRQRDLIEIKEQLVTLLLVGYTSKEQLISLVNYMLQVGSTAEPDKLIRELASRAPRHEEELMTIAEYLEQKGFKKGMEQGMEKGMEQARATILNIARSMLADGFDRATVMKLTGLSADELAQIHH